jgi:hypothetical protein
MPGRVWESDFFNDRVVRLLSAAAENAQCFSSSVAIPLDASLVGAPRSCGSRKSDQKTDCYAHTARDTQFVVFALGAERVMPGLWAKRCAPVRWQSPEALYMPTSNEREQGDRLDVVAVDGPIAEKLTE